MQQASDKKLLDEVLASALAQIEPIDPAPQRRQMLRARLQERMHKEDKSERAALTIRADEGQWHRLARGVELKVLHLDAQSKSYLLRIAAGAQVPEHEHPADEECLVLQGEIGVGALRLCAGDYHLAPRGSRHAGLLSSEHGAIVMIRTAAHGTPDFALLGISARSA